MLIIFLVDFSVHAEELQHEHVKWSSELQNKEEQFQQNLAKHKDEEQRLRELVKNLQDQLHKAETTLTEIRVCKLSSIPYCVTFKIIILLSAKFLVYYLI